MATVCIFLVLIGSCGLICRRMTESIDRRFTFEITAEERYNLMVYFLLEHIDNHIVISGCSVVLCFVSFCRWYNNPYLTFPSVISQIFVPKQKKLAVKWITSVLKKKKRVFVYKLGYLGCYIQYVCVSWPGSNIEEKMTQASNNN